MSVHIKEEQVDETLPSTDRLECRLRDQNLFKTLLACSASFQSDYLTLRIKKDSIEYFGIDETHVALCQWELRKEAFEFFSSSVTSAADFFEISLSLDLMQKVMKICKSKETVCLQYDTTQDRNTLNLSFLDPRAESAANQPSPPSSGVAVKQEPGAEGAPAAAPASKKQKAEPVGSHHKFNEFRITTRPVGSSDSMLEMPPVKEDSTCVHLPAQCFKYVMDSLLELNCPNQKDATIHVQCPQADIVDAKTGKQNKHDLVRFGTSNTSGDVNVDFIVAGNLESALQMGTEQVLMTRKEGFSETDRCRFSNKWIHKTGIALPVAENMVFHLYNGYPWIAFMPLQHDAGMIRYVVSPRLEDGTDPDDQQAAAAGEGGAPEAPDDDLFAEEDEFSD